MARATIPTLLPLTQYAKILGIDPVHFSQGISTLRPAVNSCSRVWYQFDWQGPRGVSRESIAQNISDAERDIADAIGYWPAPTYTVEEHIQYPRPAAPGWYGAGANVRGEYKSVRLSRGYFIEGGQRAVEYLDTVCWYAIDADGDGFYEIACFQLTVASTLDACQVRAYFKEWDADDAENSRTDLASSGADPEWEVRPFKVELVGTTLSAYFWVWDLFKPQLQEELGAEEINADDFGDGPPEDPCDYMPLDDLGSYVDELMFYREYTDPQTQVRFEWTNPLSCSTTACERLTQNGCLLAKDYRNSLVIPQPSSYNTSTETFTAGTWTQNTEPDAVSVWYRSGWRPENARSCQVLDDRWAQMIAMLATTRLPYGLCECSNAKELSDYWRQDAAKMTREQSFNLRPDELSNPFGQKIGEVLVWRMIRNRSRRVGRAIKA